MDLGENMADNDFEDLVESNSYFDDDGTMQGNIDMLTENVVGRRIKSVDTDEARFTITLDDGRQVVLENTNDCCAYTELKGFLLSPDAVDHVITGVRQAGNYTIWHIYADYGDVLALTVGWSPGNPYYYGFGFNLQVVESEEYRARIAAERDKAYAWNQGWDARNENLVRNANPYKGDK